MPMSWVLAEVTLAVAEPVVAVGAADELVLVLSSSVWVAPPPPLPYP